MTNGMDKTGDAMRRIKTYLIIVNLIFLTGCANKAMPDTYVENYDYQYRQWSDSIAFPKVQQGSDNIVYIYKNGFIYYMEEGNDVLVPLCNKVDCLHDRETDQQKMSIWRNWQILIRIKISQLQNAEIIFIVFR